MSVKRIDTLKQKKEPAKAGSLNSNISPDWEIRTYMSNQAVTYCSYLQIHLLYQLSSQNLNSY